MAVKLPMDVMKAMCSVLGTVFVPAWKTASGLEMHHAAFVSQTAIVS